MPRFAHNRPKSRRLRLALAAGCFVLPFLLAPSSKLSAQTDESPLTADKPDAPAEPDAAAADAEAKAILAQARKRLGSYSSVQADLLESVMIGMRSYRAEGKYLQGPDGELRLEFEIAVKGQDGGRLTGALLQISDGNIMHSSYQIGSDLRVTRRDLKQILDAIENNPSIDENLQQARLGLGGLPSLLASIEKAMTFNRTSVEEIKGVRYIVLFGGWSPDYLKQLGSSDPTQLPPYVPDRIRVYLDEQTLFPRRAFYLKTEEKRQIPMMTLDFHNVHTNVPVGNEEFVFVPPEGTGVQDITQQIIQAIKQAGRGDSQSAPENAK